MLVDIVVVVVIALFVLIGWKRGFLLSVYSLVSMIIAIVLACVLSPVVSSAVEATGVHDKLDTSITEYLDTRLAEKFGENVDITVDEASNELMLPSFISDRISEDIKKGESGQIHSISQRLASEASGFVCTMIAFIIVFIIVLIILHVIKVVLKVATKLPVLKQADALGGLIIGFAEGIVFVCILSMILSVFASSPSAQNIIASVQESHIGRLFYENNFIGYIMSGVL